MPIPPRATHAVYAELRERVATALAFGREQPSIEFKRTEPWETLKLKLAKAVLAMSNTRDGGLLIIGRPEEDGVDGILPDTLATYDPDIMKDFFDSFADPPVLATIVTVPVGELDYVAIEVRQFEEEPVICKKDGGDELQRGAIYIRTDLGRPQSNKIISNRDMRALLELALDKREERFRSTAARRGFYQAPLDTERYMEELGEDLRDG